MTNKEQIKQAANEYCIEIMREQHSFPRSTFNIQNSDDVEKHFTTGANFGRQLGIEDAFEWKQVEDYPFRWNGKPTHILCKDDIGKSPYLLYIYDHRSARRVNKIAKYWRPIKLEDMP